MELPTIIVDDSEQNQHQLHEAIESVHRLLEIGASQEAVRVLAAIALQAEDTEAGEHASNTLDELGLRPDEVEGITQSSLQSRLNEWRKQHTRESGREAAERHIAILIRLEEFQAAAERARDQVERATGETTRDRWQAFIKRYSLPSVHPKISKLSPQGLAQAFQQWSEFAMLGGSIRQLRTDDPETNEQAVEYWGQTLRMIAGHNEEDEDEVREHLDHLARSLSRRIHSISQHDPKAAALVARLLSLGSPDRDPNRKSAQPNQPESHSEPSSPVGRQPRELKKDTDLFDQLKVRRYQIKLDAKAVSMLREEPKLYVRGTFIEDDTIYSNVGIRLKGSWGSFRELDEGSKTAFTIKFNHFEKGKRFHGLRRIILNNAVQDPSYLRESLGYSLFRDAGIPAPRINYATLSFNGRDQGLYVQVEAVTKDFLKRWYSKTGGNLYEGPGDVTHWQELDLDSNQDRVDRTDLRQLTHTIETANEERPWTTIEKEINLDHFTRFLAMEQIVHHWDGYTQINNYRIYRDPTTERFEFFPHGGDQLFEDVHASVLRPQGGILGRALLQTQNGNKRFRRAVIALMESVWKEKQLRRRVAAHYHVLRPYLAKRKGGTHQLQEFEDTVFHVLNFIDFRRLVVDRQLGQQQGRSWRSSPHHFDEDHHFLEEHIWH